MNPQDLPPSALWESHNAVSVWPPRAGTAPLSPPEIKTPRKDVLSFEELPESKPPNSTHSRSSFSSFLVLARGNVLLVLDRKGERDTLMREQYHLVASHTCPTWG